ncbi:phosphoribosylaminoimidazolecarboxamide formyltransferase [Phycisphaerales bacterium AB-hyl4]|uniref:Phosphoribosylaminoimidazolecarboxamide formyltransferase n=1 Tax=Natronomicrosphaera hydrolytica TaxID=3242702 RepID=A0ABV4U8M6_9BACT
MEIKLKYGINPNQSFARVVVEGDKSPLAVRNGSPSYINILDGLRGWQLVRELKQATGKAAAASYKHVSPAGVAVAGELSEQFRQAFFVPDDMTLSPIASAYAKARSSDRVASFGDFISVSDKVDVSLARLIKPEVSDGIIAPDYDAEALELLQSKKGGNYVILQIDPDWQPTDTEYRLEFGLRLEQSYNDAVIDRELISSNVVTQNRTLSDEAIETLLVTTITLKHTQSNSVALGYQGQAVGIGAGQQSRIACTRLACEKMDRWMLAQHPHAAQLQYKETVPRSEKANLVDALLRWYELDVAERSLLQSQLTKPAQPITLDERTQWLKNFGDVSMSSDAFFPFRDNLDRSARSGVKYVAQPGGSKRDADVIAAADQHGMVMVATGLRLFLH